MAFYKVTVYKLFNGVPFAGETWSNVYTVDAASATAALSKGTAIATLEMAVSYQPIEVTKVTVVSHDDTSDKLVGFPGASAALDPAGLGGYLPLFNTTRVVLRDPILNPEMKYLRLGATPGNIAVGEWDGEFVDFVQANYADDLVALGIIGPNGGTISEALVLPSIQIRQLDWKRRSRPGFKRGWVPV